jgi:hypothetical protein
VAEGNGASTGRAWESETNKWRVETETERGRSTGDGEWKRETERGW